MHTLFQDIFRLCGIESSHGDMLLAKRSSWRAPSAAGARDISAIVSLTSIALAITHSALISRSRGFVIIATASAPTEVSHQRVIVFVTTLDVETTYWLLPAPLILRLESGGTKIAPGSVERRWPTPISVKLIFEC